jgi:pSer/pThr/pTyr-binding forkhead associated (FHA) protein
MPEEFLLVTEGASQGARVDLSGSAVTIGREDGNDLVLDDTQASRRHARVAPADGGWTVEDLGSTNGTYLNGGRLSGTRRLTASDEIRIGRTVITLRSTAAHTEIGTPDDLGLTSAAPEVAAPPPPCHPGTAR